MRGYAVEIRALVDQVTSFPLEERERIYRKYFEKPSNTVQFLCQYYRFDEKRILDATCHYGYFLAYFDPGSAGLDGDTALPSVRQRNGPECLGRKYRRTASQLC